jgi:uncharacterized protein (DUF1684 family)
MTNLEQFRAMKDQFFKSDPNSPLMPDQRTGFTALSYFAENTALRLELAVETLPEPAEVEMQTSTGEVQTYLRWGKITFEVDGQPVELTLYVPQGGHGYFLPFTDLTSGQETYGAGRYLDPEPRPGGKLLVDFNMAYNPYCAYNEHWSCPLTPVENRLKVRIEAGEKNFK